MPRACSTTCSADGATEVDAATDYAQHIPVRVIAHMLGVPPEDGDRFRVFIHRILETAGPERPGRPPRRTPSIYYLDRGDPGRTGRAPSDDLIGYLLDAGAWTASRWRRDHIVGTIALLLIAGIDTTWSAIGASLWHLAQHPEA